MEIFCKKCGEETSHVRLEHNRPIGISYTLECKKCGEETNYDGGGDKVKPTQPQEWFGTAWTRR